MMHQLQLNQLDATAAWESERYPDQKTANGEVWDQGVSRSRSRTGTWKTNILQTRTFKKANTVLMINSLLKRPRILQHCSNYLKLVKYFSPKDPPTTKIKNGSPAFKNRLSSFDLITFSISRRFSCLNNLDIEIKFIDWKIILYTLIKYNGSLTFHVITNRLYSTT